MAKTQVIAFSDQHLPCGHFVARKGKRETLRGLHDAGSGAVIVYCIECRAYVRTSRRGWRSGR